MLQHPQILLSIVCNLRLWLFLNKQTNSNSALQPLDKKRDRRRNLLPAKVGIFHLFSYVTSFCFLASIYGNCSLELDSGTKAFMVALFSDAYFCFIAPLIDIMGNTKARRKLVCRCL